MERNRRLSALTVAAACLLIPLGARAGPVPIVRIGIVPEVPTAAVDCEGPWNIGVIGGRGAVEENVGGSSWTFTSIGDQLRARDDRGRDRGGGRDTLYIFAASRTGPPLRVGGKPYRGELLVFAAGGGHVTVVDVLDLESYLRGVLPLEIGRGGENGQEALKAQAVAARSYTLACVNRWRTRGFDLLATVDDQVYGGIASERPETDRALAETCGIVALSEGAPIQAYSSSTCGGMTTTPEEVWGRAPLPYLQVQRDSPGEGEDSFCSASPQHRWRETWTGAEIEKILVSSLPAVIGSDDARRLGSLRDIRIKKRSESYRIQEMEIEFSRRTVTIGGDRVRWILRRPSGEGLKSALLLDVKVSKRKGRVTRVTIDGAGYGHGVGLCQMGALGMAREGYDFVKILHFYYRGAQLVRAYDHCPA